jgi:alkanesulfonate monooxygenase SsuD/methylene tetrahydromethanopterin reductase-like flavin-dependent oxidoreductase (luciferase family)
MGRGFGITAAVNHSVVRQLAGAAEERGYTSLWVNDIPHAEGLAALAAAADGSERIRLGVGVIPLDGRPPASIVERIRELGLPHDRLILGIGGGAAGDALARVRAGAAELERALDVEIVIGALGPKMAQLAGEVAEGVLLNWSTTDHAGETAALVRAAAEGAGRPEPELIAYVRCGLLPGARPRLEEELARYAGVASMDRHVARMGVAAADTCVLSEDPGALRAGIAAFEPVLDETVVRAITPSDSIEDLLTLLDTCAP